MDDQRRRVPRTDALLADPRLAPALRELGREAVKAEVLRQQQRVRSGEIAAADCPDAVVDALDASGPRTVLNATGVVLHTNLGRAPLAQRAVDAVQAAAGYTDVEFDLATGARARRGRGALQALLDAVPAAQDALVVNNGAAALVLATTALADGRDVLVSRGEMVEIGDGFRLPDLIASTGARLREVGTTNRTHLRDYADAVDERTGCILKVHPSNFRVTGFTSRVEVGALARRGPPVVADVGSGLLAPHPLLPDEPDVASALEQGAQVVTASGDKLLGGPQAGLLLGGADTLGRLRRHPLARALRVDKLTLAALEATLRSARLPVWQYLLSDEGQLRERAERLAAAVGGADVVPSAGAVGGGGAPGVELPGWAVALPEGVAAALRAGDPPVVARTERGRCLLDLRCVPETADAVLVAAVLAALHPAQARPVPASEP